MGPVHGRPAGPLMGRKVCAILPRAGHLAQDWADLTAPSTTKWSPASRGRIPGPIEAKTVGEGNRAGKPAYGGDAAARRGHPNAGVWLGEQLRAGDVVLSVRLVRKERRCWPRVAAMAMDVVRGDHIAGRKSWRMHRRGAAGVMVHAPTDCWTTSADLPSELDSLDLDTDLEDAVVVVARPGRAARSATFDVRLSGLATPTIVIATVGPVRAACNQHRRPSTMPHRRSRRVSCGVSDLCWARGHAAAERTRNGLCWLRLPMPRSQWPTWDAGGLSRSGRMAPPPRTDALGIRCMACAAWTPSAGKPSVTRLVVTDVRRRSLQSLLRRIRTAGQPLMPRPIVDPGPALAVAGARRFHPRSPALSPAARRRRVW